MKPAFLAFTLISILTACTTPPLSIRAQTEPPPPKSFQPSIALCGDVLPQHITQLHLVMGARSWPLTFDPNGNVWRLTLSADDIEQLSNHRTEMNLPATLQGSVVNSKGVSWPYNRELTVQIPQSK